GVCRFPAMPTKPNLAMSLLQLLPRLPGFPMADNCQAQHHIRCPWQALMQRRLELGTGGWGSTAAIPLDPASRALLLAVMRPGRALAHCVLRLAVTILS